MIEVPSNLIQELIGYMYTFGQPFWEAVQPWIWVFLGIGIAFTFAWLIYVFIKERWEDFFDFWEGRNNSIDKYVKVDHFHEYQSNPEKTIKHRYIFDNPRTGGGGSSSGLSGRQVLNKMYPHFGKTMSNKEKIIKKDDDSTMNSIRASAVVQKYGLQDEYEKRGIKFN